MKAINIEKFFLSTLLKITVFGISLILISNLLLFPEDTLSIYIAAAMLVSCIFSYLTRNNYPTLSVLIITSVAVIAMSYQRLTLPATSTTLSVLIIVGFIYSVMLKGKIMWIMHGINFILLNTIFVFHIDDYITAGITYSTMYFILTYATGILKCNYDKINRNLTRTNIELNQKAEEIEAQNEELLQIQENLNTLNQDLEKLVNQRTAKIQLQNETLIKYSYSNAHHLRGPVARLLGLANVYELEKTPEADLIIEKMVTQAKEIDSVVKQINVELESGNVELELGDVELELGDVDLK
ncbi:MAG: signal transduction histidine kinase [Marivirga sp.]|jgi:signal transduction histidine kinase